MRRSAADEADSLPAGRKARGFFTIRQKQHDKLHYLLNFSTIVGEAGVLKWHRLCNNKKKCAYEVFILMANFFIDRPIFGIGAGNPVAPDGHPCHFVAAG
ncbi:hypothetical protein MJ560_20735 [Klebsiella pneumoniae]|nr:hypothetical protein MJ560_20735 [Klebsiella pneumoniae]